MTFLLDARPDGGDLSRDARVAPVGKVVRRAEHLAFVDARQLLAQARADAERIVEQARDVYRAERERGYADGQQAAQLEQAAAMLRIREQTSVYLKRVEADIVGVVVASMRRIVADFDDTERVLAVVRGGLALLRQQKQILLRVHTDDAVLVRQNLESLLSRFPSVDYVDVVADDRYERGACRIETPVGTIETSLGRQLDVLQHALEQIAPSTDGEDRDRPREADNV